LATVYVVQMTSIDEKSKHNYTLGVYSDIETAIYYGQVEEKFRQNRYYSSVTGFELDANIPQNKIEQYEGSPKSVKTKFDLED